MHERRFNPEHLSHLDSPERRKMLPPEKLLDYLCIGPEDTVLDLGAGTGYFTIPAAKRTEGQVVALDVEPRMLEVLKSNVEENLLTNVRYETGQIENIPLEGQSMKKVIASLVLHEVEPLEKGIEEIRRVLTADGKLFLLEWEKTPSEFGPPLHHRIASKVMKEQLESNGFQVLQTEFPTSSHYLMIASLA
ncbi:MAG: class I SAM-dependent methyltransferase [Alicyclobacillaceae bacterium]|nr:class I SAM-dependent methyltransferase [Alicyclobacillaceae bacterium]MCY0896996.1 class I SAM-dependent methyltransferase [Alicyclobacillaceae bacterium]